MKILKHAVAVGLSALGVEALIQLLFPERPQVMAFSPWPVVAWAVIGALFALVRSRLNLVLIMGVLVFYLVGNLNAVASYHHYGHHYLTDLQAANLIYVAYAAVFVLGILSAERYLRVPEVADHAALRKEALDSVFFLGAVAFPMVWLADELISLRRVPILTGESIVNEMYAIEYGRLYGYGVLLGVSALLIWSKIQHATGMFRAALWASLAITAFAMVFDGRRVFLIVFLGALLAFQISAFPRKPLWRPLAKSAVALLAVYVSILYFRQGGRLVTYADAAQIFSKVGVEYRDFAYVVTHFRPGSLPGYSWLGGAIGGFGNWLLLALLGQNKNELVFSGSAYQLAIAFRSGFGIRIGLFPEMWLQFGMLGAALAVPVAWLYVWITKLVEGAQSEVGRIFACMAFGVAILSYVGQATAITGYWSLILYLLLVWWFLDRFRYAGASKLARRRALTGSPQKTTQP